MRAKILALVVALGVLASLSLLLLDKPGPVAAGIVDLGSCGPSAYSYNASGIMGLAYIEDADFYSYLGQSRTNSVSIQLNAYVAGGGKVYWVQNVLVLTKEEKGLYLTAADYLYNLTDLSSLKAEGGGRVVAAEEAGRRIALYQYSETAGTVSLPASLGASIEVEGPALRFSYMVNGVWKTYDVVTVGGGTLAVIIGVRAGNRTADVEWVVVGPRSGYAAYIERWSGWAALYYEEDGVWRQPPCAYAASSSPSTAEFTDRVHGIAEYYMPDGRVAQSAGAPGAGLLWRPAFKAEGVAGALVISAVPPRGAWVFEINGTEISPAQLPASIPAAPGIYAVRGALYAGRVKVFESSAVVRVS